MLISYYCESIIIYKCYEMFKINAEKINLTVNVATNEER